MVDTATTAAGGGLGTGEIVGIVLGSLGVLTLIALVVIFVGRRRRREPMLENPNLTPTPTMRDANYGSSGLHQLK
jgi:LPXTG-motif cell wall-anchored protein